MLADMLTKLVMYFQYPFVQRAMIAGVLIALCSSLLGVSLVLRRFSFIGDGLSHVAFGALSLSAVLNTIMLSVSGTVVAGVLSVFVKNQMLLVMPITMLVAWLLLGATKRSKIMGDASLAMLSVGSLGIGYLIMNKFSTSGNISSDVCSTLFGSTSILTLSDFDLWMCVVMSVVVIAVFVLCYNKIFAVTFDADFASATGTRAGAYNTVIALITAAVIVLAMNLVGSLLISALVVFPALSAMRVFKSFRGVVTCAAVLSVLSAALGIIASILLSTPVGSTIVVIQILVFIVFSIAGLFQTKGGLKK